MIHLGFYDTAGNILAVGTKPDAFVAARDPRPWVELPKHSLAYIETHRVDLSGSAPVLVERATPQPMAQAPETYATRRRREYPSIEDQLDALWKSFPAGGLGPEGEAMRQIVQAVKAKYPKTT